MVLLLDTEWKLFNLHNWEAWQRANKLDQSVIDHHIFAAHLNREFVNKSYFGNSFSWPILSQMVKGAFCHDLAKLHVSDLVLSGVKLPREQIDAELGGHRITSEALFREISGDKYPHANLSIRWHHVYEADLKLKTQHPFDDRLFNRSLLYLFAADGFAAGLGKNRGYIKKAESDGELIDRFYDQTSILLQMGQFPAFSRETISEMVELAITVANELESRVLGQEQV